MLVGINPPPVRDSLFEVGVAQVGSAQVGLARVGLDQITLAPTCCTRPEYLLPYVGTKIATRGNGGCSSNQPMCTSRCSVTSAGDKHKNTSSEDNALWLTTG